MSNREVSVSKAVELPEFRALPVSSIRLNNWNPNVEAEEDFNNLVASIKRDGFNEVVLVRPLEPEQVSEVERQKGIGFEVMHGEHRFRAAQVLDMEQVPCLVKTADDDLAKFISVSHNMIRGRINQPKFAKLYEDLSKRYSKDAIQQLMAITDPGVLDRFIGGIRSSLPPELRGQLDKSKAEIKSVDDLSRILNEIFSQYGDDLRFGFMIFTFKGQTHTWVVMDKALKAQIEQFAAICRDRKIDMGKVMAMVLKAGLPALTEYTVQQDQVPTSVLGPAEPKTN